MAQAAVRSLRHCFDGQSNRSLRQPLASLTDFSQYAALSLAHVETCLGHYEAALAAAVESVAVAQQTHDRHCLMQSLILLCSLAQAAGPAADSSTAGALRQLLWAQTATAAAARQRRERLALHISQLESELAASGIEEVDEPQLKLLNAMRSYNQTGSLEVEARSWLQWAQHQLLFGSGNGGCSAAGAPPPHVQDSLAAASLVATEFLQQQSPLSRDDSLPLPPPEDEARPLLAMEGLLRRSAWQLWGNAPLAQSYFRQLCELHFPELPAAELCIAMTGQAYELCSRGDLREAGRTLLQLFKWLPLPASNQLLEEVLPLLVGFCDSCMCC